MCAKIEKYIVYKPDHMHSAPSMSTAHLHMFSRLAIYIIFTRISSICVFRFTNGIYIPPLTYLKVTRKLSLFISSHVSNLQY